MAKPLPESNGGDRILPERASAPHMPRWVKVFGIVALIILAVLLIVLHLPAVGGMGGHHG